MTVTAEQLISTVREIANADPEFVYTPRQMNEVHGIEEEEAALDGVAVDPENTTCTYVGTTPEKCCIFGRALMEFDIAKPEWDNPNAVDHRLNTLAIRELIEELVQRGEIEAPTPAQRVWMTSVQEKQDASYTWAGAIEGADNEHPLPSR